MVGTWFIYEFKFIENTIKSNLNLKIQAVAQSTKSQVQSLVDTSDEILKTLKFHRERKGPFNEKLLDEYFQSGILNSSNFNQAGIIDKNGIYIYSNLRNQKRIDLSDREHFKVHKVGFQYQLFFSKPVLGRASNKWSIQITRKIVNASGEFNGVAVISIDPKIIISYFDKLSLGENSLIALMDTEGRIRTLKANGRDYIDNSVKQVNLPKDWETNTLSSKAFQLDFDQVDRYYTFEHLDNSNLIVLVGTAKADYLQSLALIRNKEIYFGGIIILIITLATIVFDRLLLAHSNINSKLTHEQKISSSLKYFYTTLLSKLSAQNKNQLSQIEQNANFIESQSNEELSLISAKSISDHTVLLRNITDRALTLDELMQGKLTLNFSIFSPSELTSRLDNYFKTFEKVYNISFEPMGRIELDQHLKIDIEKLANILYQVLIFVDETIGHANSFIARYSINSKTTKNSHLNFQLPLHDRVQGTDFKQLIESKVSLEDIDLRGSFELMLAKYHLQEMQGLITLITPPAGVSYIEIDLPV